MNSVQAIRSSSDILASLLAQRSGGAGSTSGVTDFQKVLLGTQSQAPAPVSRTAASGASGTKQASGSAGELPANVGDYVQLLGLVASLFGVLSPGAAAGGETVPGGGETDQDTIKNLADTIGQRFEIGDYCQVFTNETLLAYLFGNKA